MTCYNKAEYIGIMLDSILAQKWDNIELILVNDGSTDGTRDVIEGYESALHRRGYQVVVIDQENSGVCLAAKVGLEHATGDYICLVDADDELTPDYVSTMAGWLDIHPEYDYCACGFVFYTNDGTKRGYGYERQPKNIEVLTPEHYILQDTWWALWSYMLRRDYLERCRITENYATGGNGSHEPGFMIPMTAYGGRVTPFSDILYRHRREVDGAHSQHKTIEATKKHFNTYFDLMTAAINILPEDLADSRKKKKLLRLAAHTKNVVMYSRANKLGLHYKKEKYFNKILFTINKYFFPKNPIIREHTQGKESEFLKEVKRYLRNFEGTNNSKEKIRNSDLSRFVAECDNENKKGKVSMVITCYNKAPYLETMFKSVKNQIWDKLELVIVDDGSTDDSMQIIKRWRKKFAKRGYKIKIIKQENTGVAAAIKRGMEASTGKYICFPDSDDELDFGYVSEMATVLEANRDVEFVMCNFATRREENGGIKYHYEPDSEFECTNMLERYLMRRFNVSACRYLFRRNYLTKVGLPEHLLTEPRVTQEPQIMIPVWNGKGKFIRIDRYLYIYNSYIQGIRRDKTKNPFEWTMNEYHALQLKAIAQLPVSEERKLELASIAGLGRFFACSELYEESVVDKYFTRFFANRITGDRPKLPQNFKGRVIAYGVYSKDAMEVLHGLIDTPLWPLFFWDEHTNCDSVTFNGAKITAPQPEIIQEHDCIICFRKPLPGFEEELKKSPVATLMTQEDVHNWLADWYF